MVTYIVFNSSTYSMDRKKVLKKEIATLIKKSILGKTGQEDALSVVVAM